MSGREADLPPLLAMGDPQANRDVVLRHLTRHGLLRPPRAGQLLEDTPRFAPHTRLLSIGDHFDWGLPNQPAREHAARDGEATLRFLCAAPPEQVIVLAGNHDLARVADLHDVDDHTFAGWQVLADAHYYGHGDEAAHGDLSDDSADRFFAACRRLPSTEMVARDLSTYRASQQALVRTLLLRRRLRLAHAEHGVLFTHAGITRKTVARLGLLEEASAARIAAGLNQALDDAVDHCLRGRRRQPLSIPGIYRPADGIGEGDGMLLHRPLYLEKDQWLEPRRFDPRTLPRGLWQVVGHVRDARCISALGPWSEPTMPRPGVLRHLMVTGPRATPTVVYRHGLPPPRASVDADAAVMIFIDGAMNACPEEDYELLAVDDHGRLGVAHS